MSADIFATSRSVIKREAATPVLSASSVILSYMITTVSETNIKKFLNPLSALCTGSQSLDSKEKNVAVEALKEAKVFPPGNLDNKTKFCSLSNLHKTCTIICYFGMLSFDEYFGEEKFSALSSKNKVAGVQLWTSFFPSATLFLEGSALNLSSQKRFVK